MQAPGELKSVGKRVARLNGPDIVTGRIQYADDIQLPGMLFGRILRSPHGHARIRKIDTSPAKELPGVVDVVCGRDVPDLSIFESEEVCYQGQKVAAVAAVDPDIAEDALALIQVDYEVLPAVVDPVDAMDPDAPEAVLGASTEDVKDPDGRRLRNVTAYNVMEEGDVDQGFADADAIVEAEYQVPLLQSDLHGAERGDGARGGGRKADRLGRGTGHIHQAGGSRGGVEPSRGAHPRDHDRNRRQLRWQESD